MSGAHDSSPVPSGGRRSLLRPAVVLRVATALAFIAFVPHVVYDQLRAVPEPAPFTPPAPRPRMSDGEPAPAPVESEAERLVGTGADPAEGADDREEIPGPSESPAPSLAVPELSERGEELEKTIRAYSSYFGPVMDKERPASLKEKQDLFLKVAREAIRRYYADAEQAIKDLRAVPEATRGKPYDDAWEHLRRTALSVQLHFSGRPVSSYLPDLLPLEDAKAALYEAFQRAHVEVCAMRGNWEYAAAGCLFLSDRNGDEAWNREVYYWRRCGLRGRGALAFRTVQRGLGSVGNWTHGLNPFVTMVFLNDPYPSRSEFGVAKYWKRAAPTLESNSAE